MGRGPSKRQMGVALSEELKAELEAASGRSGHSIAEEIRQRLDRTFEQDAIDPQTRALADKLVWLAEQLKRDKGFDWHMHAKAFEALVEAVNAAFERRKPPDYTGQSAASDLFWGDDDPKTLGRSMERHYERFLEAMLKDELELRETHNREEKQS